MFTYLLTYLDFSWLYISYWMQVNIPYHIIIIFFHYGSATYHGNLTYMNN